MESKSVRAIIATAKRIEKKYKVPVSVIARTPTSPMPWISANNEATIFVVTSKIDPKGTFAKIHEDPQFKFSPIQQMYPVTELVSMVRQNPNAIRNNIGGTGFIPPFWFNREAYGTFAKEVKKEFETQFGEKLKKEIQKRFERLGMKNQKGLNGRIKTLKAEVASRKKLVGKPEQKQIFNALERMAKQIHAEKTDVIVVLDKSGRPLALPLKKVLLEAYGITPKVFFINPSLTKPPWDKHMQTIVQHQQQLAKEHPELAKSLPGKKVMIIDDKVARGETKANIEHYGNSTIGNVVEILKRFNPTSVSHAYVSAYHGIDISWRAQNMHNVRTDYDSYISIRAKLNKKKRQQINNMYKGLGIIAGNVAIKIKKRR